MSRLLLYFAAVIGLSWAEVPYGDIKFKIFTPEATDFEKDLFKAMEVNSKYMPDDDIQGAAAETAKNVVESLPVIGDAAGLLLSFSGMLEDESDWKKTFTHAIADGSDRRTLEQDIVKMQARVESIQKSLMNDKNLDLNTIAWSTRKDLDYMMNIFAAHKSLFKKYALIGAPVVIQLAELIASLSSNINNHDISCSMRNILLEYRKRSVDARMDEIATEWTSSRGHHDKFMGNHYDLPLIRSRVMSLDYNKIGYNLTSELPCQKYSKSSSVPKSTYAVDDKFNDEYYYGVLQPAYQKYEKRHNFPDNVVAKEFNKFDVGYRSLTPELKCAVDYFGLVRHRVEQLFPVELFDAYCGTKDSQISTGRGYLTIKFKHGSFVVENDGMMPEYDGDEAYVEVYIKKKGSPFELKWTSPSMRECFQCDFNRAFESDKIDKDSVVMIEVWDEDRGRKATFNPDDLLISGADATRTVNDLLKNGMFFLRNHQDKRTELYNYIETVAFWKDEYKLPPIADLFLKKNPKSD